MGEAVAQIGGTSGYFLARRLKAATPNRDPNVKTHVRLKPITCFDWFHIDRLMRPYSAMRRKKRSFSAGLASRPGAPSVPTVFINLSSIVVLLLDSITPGSAKRSVLPKVIDLRLCCRKVTLKRTNYAKMSWQGTCKDSGTERARAVGAVFWGEKSNANCNHTVPGPEPPTNNRVTIYAVLLAVKCSNPEVSLMIFTNSEHTIRHVCYWAGKKFANRVVLPKWRPSKRSGDATGLETGPNAIRSN
ncbi:hypothetical protein DFH08DRAFT_1023651 [Mycena albidolilacea]|uniref:Uncharacterized protein n=1 Tax=Mycena albidolilacea TaxID=1033008 RepID=A0AAD6ZL70_9AGAR|nr:hypothetical protein DFH08DRAFT_1023651 [Mycena albidolilacea]